MQSLPYELLQHVASNLLPRYLCRLAMVSRHHYKHLYNDLLRWHAKWRQVAAPRYKHLYKKEVYYDMALIEFNKQLVLYKQTYNHRLCILNLTHKTSRLIDVERMYDVVIKVFGPIGMRELMEICDGLAGTNMLTGCYKYLDKTLLLMYLSSKHPLLSLPEKVFDNILGMLPETDMRLFILSSPYLTYLYNF